MSEVRTARDISEKMLPVVEIFGPTIQGEGALIGEVSYFVRFGGCGYRCVWCDSMHAVDPEQVKKNATKMTSREIADKLAHLAPRGPTDVSVGHSPHGIRFNTWVTLSGGDPVMWPLNGLVRYLHEAHLRIAVETQGQLWQDWLMKCDLVTVSPKGPSSKMDHKLDLDILHKYTQQLGYSKMVLKCVVFGKDDLDFAERLHLEFPFFTMYLSAGTPQGIEESGERAIRIIHNLRALAQDVLSRPKLHDCVVLPQMHTLIWGAEKGR